MSLLKRGASGSLQDRLNVLAIAMISVTLLVAASVGINMPGVVPIVLESFAFLILAAMLSAAKWDFRRDAAKSLLGSATSIASIAFFLCALVSCLFSHNRAVSMQGTIQIGVGLLLYFVANSNVRGPQNTSRLLFVLTILSLAGAVFGCAEYGANPDGQATCLFGDHQLYGSFLMILLPFVAVAAIGEKVLNKKLVAQTATVVTIIALLLAHSHSAWLGAAAGLLSIGVLSALIPAKIKVGLGDPHRMLVPGLLAAAGAMFLLLCFPFAEPVLNRAYTFANAVRQDGSIDRQQMWHAAVRMVEEHPFTGIGASMFAYSHTTFSGLPVGGHQKRPTLSDQTHNLYLQTAAEMGVPGCVALIAILLSFWIVGIARLRSIDRTDRRNMLLGALGATAAFAADAFTSPSWQFGQMMILFWLSLGAGVACLTYTSTRDVKRATNVVSVPIKFRRPAEAVGFLGLAALMPVTVIASTKLNNFYPSTVYSSANGVLHHVGNKGAAIPDNTREIKPTTNSSGDGNSTGSAGTTSTSQK